MFIVSRFDSIFEWGKGLGIYAIQYEVNQSNIFTEALQQFKDYNIVLKWLKHYNKQNKLAQLTRFKMENMARHVVL